MSELRTPTPQTAHAARAAAGARARLRPDAEQRQSLADRPGGRVLWRRADHLHRAGEARSQDRPRRGRRRRDRNPPHARPGARQAARRRLPARRPRANDQFAEPARLRISPSHGAGDRQRTHRAHGRHPRAARRRGRNPRVGPAVQLQRGHRDDDGAVRILQAVSQLVS